MLLLNRVTNKNTCAVEVSSHMAALAILGAPAEFASCPFQKVSVQDAALYSTIIATFPTPFQNLRNFKTYQETNGWRRRQ